MGFLSLKWLLRWFNCLKFYRYIYIVCWGSGKFSNFQEEVVRGSGKLNFMTMKFRAFFCMNYDTKNSKNIVWLSSNTIKKAFITAFRCFGKTFFFLFFEKKSIGKNALFQTDLIWAGWGSGKISFSGGSGRRKWKTKFNDDETFSSCVLAVKSY